MSDISTGSLKRWKAFAYWIAATIIGSLVFNYAWALYSDLFYSSAPVRPSLWLTALIRLSISLTTGLVLGAAQGLVLTRITRAVSLARWITATAIGWLLYALVPFLMPPWTGSLLIGDVTGMLRLGILTGLCQWLVLRKSVSRSWLWIVVCVVGWQFAYWAAYFVWTGPTFFMDPEWTMVHGLFDGLEVGIVTWFGLVWLIKPVFHKDQPLSDEQALQPGLGESEDYGTIKGQ